jgi:hypothetical protein
MAAAMAQVWLAAVGEVKAAVEAKVIVAVSREQNARILPAPSFPPAFL